MSLSALQEYTFISKYARYLPDKKRRETWQEAVSRVEEMMLEKYREFGIEEEIKYAYDMMRKKRVLGSQRALQFGGQPILKKNARQYNCISSYCDRLRFFQECMWLLLCGCGTGFSVQKHHIAKLPRLLPAKDRGSKKFVIDDSIEGWADAIGVLVSSYFEQDELFPDYNGKTINFDFSKISPAGTYLNSSSGKAPGPEPLKKALGNIKALLDKTLRDAEFSNRKIKPITCYDIIMHSSDAVISGGVRRSATIALFSPDDEEMMAAKTGDWYHKNPQRARSNNSVVLLRDKTTFEEYEKLMKYTREFGEPGTIWVSDLEALVNPCVEIQFYAYDEYGNSGWQACNLSTINCAKIKSRNDFFDCCKAASIIGTLQAGFTDFPYLGEVSERIVRREALLGVSMTGIMECPEIVLDEKTQRDGAEIVKQVNMEMAKKIKINPAARTTCCKPEGTSSAMLGTSSGIHPHHAKRYIRRVQANKSEDVYQFFKQFNPKACEHSVWSANNTDDVISFCVEVKDGAKTKNQISAIELLKIVKKTQANWVRSGTNKDLCTQNWLEHNVSNTITVKPDEWDEVTRFIYDNRYDFCGVSLLPLSGDKDYPQAPFTTVYLPNEMLSEYGSGIMFISGIIEHTLNLWEDNLWLACDALLEIIPIKGKAKEQWKYRCKKFANNYFNGDIKKLTYAMKDIYNYKLWIDLNREYVQVDYTQMIEERDNTNFEQEAACAGGVCMI